MPLNSSAMLVDIHTHILPEKFPDILSNGAISPSLALEHHKPGCARIMRDGALFREVLTNCWDPQVRLAECDQLGVDVHVLSTVPVMFSYRASATAALSVAQFLNEHIGELVASFPKRFVGLGTLPMQDITLACAELERCIRQLGLAGVEIGSNINGENLDSERLYPFWEQAQALNAAIFVHPWEMIGAERMKSYFLPWLVGMPSETSLAICSILFGGVLERFPNLKLAFAHGGGSFPYIAGRVEHGYQMRPDLCAVSAKTAPSVSMQQIWVDSLVHSPNALRLLIETIGIEHIMCGTDYPFAMRELIPGSTIDALSDLPAEQREQLKSLNALRWLGLDKQKFL